jgi:hypothetical protein
MANPHLTLNVSLARVEDKRQPNAMVYVFDDRGKFLASEALPKKERSKVTLKLPERSINQQIEVMIAPITETDLSDVPKWMEKDIRKAVIRRVKPKLADIQARDAFTQKIQMLEQEMVVDIQIPWDQLELWLMCPCNVHGRLYKRVLFPDGSTRDWGICHACICIYEVDKIPMLIQKLPDKDIFRLRDDLWREIQDPLPDPPEPIPVPPELFYTKINQGFESLTKVDTADVRRRLDRKATPVIPLPPPREIVKKSKTFPIEKGTMNKLLPIFQAEGVETIRLEFLDNAYLLPKYLCQIAWFWGKITMDFIKCICTDTEGYFDTTIHYLCSGDKPDLYFKAYQCIGGTLHTLYDPGAACHTYWNYVCGSEVNLLTDDPAAVTCVPPDPVDPPAGVTRWVMPLSVGGLRLDQIKPYWIESGGTWVKQSTPAEKVGLTEFGDHDGSWVDAPFGDNLYISQMYSPEFPINTPGQPFYYRWQYRKSGDTTWSDFAPPVAADVVRHYIDQDLAHPDLPPTFPAYILGPIEKGGKHVYEYKPHNPPALAGHDRRWPVDNWFGETYHGILKSTKLPGGVFSAAGKYQIKLSVYDASGILISPGTSFKFIVPTSQDPVTLTVHARLADPTEIIDGGFVFTLHIDNNNCEAEIFDTSVDALPAGPCGFIPYKPGDDARLSFKAKHPNGFGRFRFLVVKGSFGAVNPACAPDPTGFTWPVAPLVTQANVNGYVRDPGSIYTKDIDVSTLLGGCKEAAFAETIYVKALATNGWTRLSWLDASATPKAFALEKKQ